MSKNKGDNKLVPAFRFSEFEGDGEWEIMTLGETSKWYSGGTPSKANDSYWNGEIPWISAASMRGKYYKNSNKKVTEIGVKNGTKIAPENSILLLVRGSMLYKKIPIGITKRNVAFNQDLKCLIVKSNINVEYLYYFISASEHFLMSKVMGTGIGAGKLDTSILKNIKFYRPKPEEQQKIANTLISLDNLIAAHHEKLDALQAHKKGLLQQLFPAKGETVPKVRFGEFNGKWDKKTFKEIFTIGSGRDYKHLSNGDIPVYGTGGYMLSVNDFLYDGKSACIGRKGTINKPMFLSGKFWTVDTLFYTHSFKNCSSEFVYLLFQNINWLKYNEAGGVPSLSKTIIYKIEVYVPKPKEQQKIVDCITFLDERIAAQSEKIKALKEHKKGLMQQLFPNISS